MDLEQANRNVSEDTDVGGSATLAGQLINASGMIYGDGSQVARGGFQLEDGSEAVSPETLGEYEQESV